MQAYTELYRGHYILHIDTQHNDTKINDIQHNDTQRNGIQHNSIQHNDTQHNGDQHNKKNMLHSAQWHSAKRRLMLIMSVFYAQCHNWVYYAYCRCAEFSYAECHYIKCCGAAYSAAHVSYSRNLIITMARCTVKILRL
jgi:hypothetical protein